MSQEYFVVGDIHGHYDKLEILLKEWNKEKEQLIFLGDYIDRGPQSKQVLELVRSLQEMYGAIVLKGNHEDMLIEWAHHPIENEHLYLPQGGVETLQSFGITGHDSFEMCEQFHQEEAGVLSLLKGLSLYYESESFIFVHAGVDLELEDWKDTNPFDFLWIRRDFHYSKNNTGKIIVFGHTPTYLLHTEKNYLSWVSDDGKIGIDGGAIRGGNLIGIRISESKPDSFEEVHVDDFNRLGKRTVPLYEK